MYEEFCLKDALERLDKALPCGNNSLCQQKEKTIDACFDCILFDLKEYYAELNGVPIVGEPYGNIDDLKTKIDEQRIIHEMIINIDKKIINEKCNEIMSLRDEIIAKEKELAVLRDKHRWRNQKDEPAPIGEYIHVCYRAGIIHGFSFPGLFRYSRDSKLFFDYWRPLSLPEDD